MKTNITIEFDELEYQEYLKAIEEWKNPNIRRALDIILDHLKKDTLTPYNVETDTTTVAIKYSGKIDNINFKEVFADFDYVRGRI